MIANVFLFRSFSLRSSPKTVSQVVWTCRHGSLGQQVAVQAEGEGEGEGGAVNRDITIPTLT